MLPAEFFARTGAIARRQCFGALSGRPAPTAKLSTLGQGARVEKSFLEQIGAILGVGVELDVRLANQAERTPIAWFFNTT